MFLFKCVRIWKIKATAIIQNYQTKAHIHRAYVYPPGILIMNFCNPFSAFVNAMSRFFFIVNRHTVLISVGSVFREERDAITLNGIVYVMGHKYQFYVSK